MWNVAWESSIIFKKLTSILQQNSVIFTMNTSFIVRPYDGKWSKTMAGYGSEDDHFVVELTYNYDIKEYQLGNDFQVYIGHFSVQRSQPGPRIKPTL